IEDASERQLDDIGDGMSRHVAAEIQHFQNEVSDVQQVQPGIFETAKIWRVPAKRTGFRPGALRADSLYGLRALQIWDQTICHNDCPRLHLKGSRCRQAFCATKKQCGVAAVWPECSFSKYIPGRKAHTTG